MSVYIDRIQNDKNLPISYTINIKTLSIPKRPLTCYITNTPRTSNQLNYIKPSICLEKSKDNKSRSSIHLPVTYSTSIHVPCHPSSITSRSPIILPSQSSHQHYHHYHHHHYYHHHHHQRQPLSSTTIKHKTSPRSTSIASTRPATTSTTTTTTITSPNLSLSSPSKKSHKNISSNKQSSHPPLPPFPSYSALVWNWFHHTPTKPSSHHKGSQSDYSETYRHELPSKRSLLFKLLTSPIDKQSSKSKHHRPCFTRKRLESSSSLPNKSNHYNE